MLLRYETAELTRSELNLWQGAQIAFGVFFLFFLLFGTSESKSSLTLALLLILCVGIQRFAIWPEVVSLGRLTDFLPAESGSGYRNRLLVMESAFFAVEAGKWVIMAVLGAMLISRGRRGGRSNGSWNQFNVIDKADNRHINR